MTGVGAVPATLHQPGSMIVQKINHTPVDGEPFTVVERHMMNSVWDFPMPTVGGRVPGVHSVVVMKEGSAGPGKHVEPRWWTVERLPGAVGRLRVAGLNLVHFDDHFPKMVVHLTTDKELIVKMPTTSGYTRAYMRLRRALEL